MYSNVASVWPAATVTPSAATVCAARAGDLEAAAIWARAGKDLPHSLVSAARAVVEPDPHVNLSWDGGLFGAGELLGEPFRQEMSALAPHANLRPPKADAIDGTLLLARQQRPC